LIWPKHEVDLEVEAAKKSRSKGGTEVMVRRSALDADWIA
jgi:hypothetical protein